eukprot:m.96696 g.96696  ORF g.96696 m.96696 type:complete len:98 (-) comp16667_c0_seq2:75-368(-)
MAFDGYFTTCCEACEKAEAQTENRFHFIASGARRIARQHGLGVDDVNRLLEPRPCKQPLFGDSRITFCDHAHFLFDSVIINTWEGNKNTGWYWRVGA